MVSVKTYILRWCDLSGTGHRPDPQLLPVLMPMGEKYLLVPISRIHSHRFVLSIKGGRKLQVDSGLAMVQTWVQT